MVIDELEFVSTPLTTRLFSVTVFTILEKLTCSITSTFSEPVNPLAVSSHPMTEIIMLRIKIGIILYILKFNKILFVLPRVLNIHSLWNRITDSLNDMILRVFLDNDHDYCKKNHQGPYHEIKGYYIIEDNYSSDD